MRGRLLVLAGLLAALAATALPRPAPAPVAEACAFASAPTTYEATEDRKLYLLAMELAAFDSLFPNDPFFSQRTIDIGTRQNRFSRDDVYIPPVLLKSIAWNESALTNGDRNLPFGSIGPVLVSFDCGYGLAQVTSGMTAPEGEAGQPSAEQALVATHFAYNVGRGAAILLDKWNAAPEARPIAGIDTNSDPKIIENWYYAVWGYNGFTGPGANRSNHPMDPVYPAWPRTPFSCDASDNLSHNRSLHPYQELVMGCIAHPPVVQGRRLWEPVDVTLPDLANPYWRAPLELAKFQSPYTEMDMPTPKPQHEDPTADPGVLARLAVLGFPNMQVDRPIGLVGVRPGVSATGTEIRISNVGSGIVPWKVTANKSWVTFSQTAGVAVGDNLACSPNAPCERTAVLTISADPRKVLGTDAAVVRIQGLGHGAKTIEVAIFVKVNVAIGIPGTAKN